MSELNALGQLVRDVIHTGSMNAGRNIGIIVGSIKQYKAEHGCVDCGEKDWRCLDFDHVGEKKLAIANNFNLSLTRIKAEIAKCVVRCSNCHRKKHADEREARQKPWTRKKYLCP